MPELSSILLFMTASLALNITPGPDMMFVIARSTGEGRRAGIASAFGISAGSICHMLAMALGLSGLLMAVPSAYEILRYAGAAYLVYIGIKTIVKKEYTQSESSRTGKSTASAFYQGMLTNLLNPKVALFFLAFLPQFVDHTAPSMTLQIIFLGILFNCSGTIVNIIVALAASRMGGILKKRLNNSSLFKWITGSVFIGLGVRLAFLDRK